jgi:hypothetical protein
MPTLNNVTVRKTYILTWNPKVFDWEQEGSFDKFVKGTGGGRLMRGRWSCGNTKRIVLGDRVFLLRQGTNRGMIGSGVVTQGSYLDAHFDSSRRGEKAVYCDLKYDTVLPVADVLPIKELQATNLGLPWNSMLKGGVEVPGQSVEKLELIWRQHLIRVGRITPQRSEEILAVEIPDEDEADFPEGREMYRLHRLRERNRVLVEKVKSQAERAGKLRCAACDFDFLEVYGDLGKGFIECHHTVPISEYKKNQKTRMEDIALVCANCHRMLHRRRPWLTIKHLSRLIVEAK